MFKNQNLFLIDFGKSSSTNQLGLTNMYTSDFNALYNDILIHNDKIYKEDKKEILSVIVPYLNKNEENKNYFPTIRDISEISGKEKEVKDAKYTDTENDIAIKSEIQKFLDKKEVVSREGANELKDITLKNINQFTLRKKLNSSKTLEVLFEEVIENYK
jgi:hypothetical protein